MISHTRESFLDAEVAVVVSGNKFEISRISFKSEDDETLYVVRIQGDVDRDTLASLHEYLHPEAYLYEASQIEGEWFFHFAVRL